MMDEIQRAHSRELVEASALRKVISPETAKALQNPAVMLAIEAAMKGSVSTKTPGRLLLVTLMPDDSYSIFSDESGGIFSWTDKAQSIVTGHNELLKGMMEGPERNRALLQTRYLNGQMLNPFSPLAFAQPMTTKNYFGDPSGTPLYAQTFITLGAVLAKTEELTANGATARSATLIMTDGQPTDNSVTLRAQLSRLIGEMKEVGDHVVAGMGIGPESLYRSTFIDMGLDPGFIYTANSRDEILEAFRMFGKAALMLTAGGANATRVFTV